MQNQQVALITGASSGFGRLIAERLIEANYIVYGTSRRDLPDTDTGVRMRVLDVTVPDSVTNCISGILDETGRIDVLVNNAGIGQRSLIEETDFNTAEAILQTNFMGTARVTQAVLPAMRRQQNGKIIFMGSLSGLVGTPGQGFYSASKHAIEGYAEALHIELSHLPIDVVILEPGFFKTDLESSISEPETTIADYDRIRDNLYQSIHEALESGGDPEVVADKVADVLADPSPNLRYRVGQDAVMVSLLKKFMPRALFEMGLKRRFDLQE